MVARIRELPQDVKDQLRSTFIIQSLPSCLVELVLNSIDASASRIEAAFELAEWECRVTDDGVGIPLHDLQLIGRRYYTTKVRATEGSVTDDTLYGFRGEALASIAEQSLLEIISRHKSSQETFTAILKGGKTLYVGPAKHSHRSSPGTTVIVRDLFYRWPVRRQHADALYGYRASCTNEMRAHMEALAIVNSSIAFQLYDTHTDALAATLPTALAATSGRRTPVQVLEHIHGKELTKRIDPIYHTHPHLTIDGFISLHPTRSKGYQWLFVNRRWVSSSDIHGIVNKLFDQSSFARQSERNARERVREMSSSPAPQTKKSKTESPRKQANRYPAFCLFLTLPDPEVMFFSEPSKQLVHFQDEEVVHKAVRTTTQDFLTKHGFSPLSKVKKSGQSCEEIDRLPFRELGPPGRQGQAAVKRTMAKAPMRHGLPDLPEAGCSPVRRPVPSIGHPSEIPTRREQGHDTTCCSSDTAANLSAQNRYGTIDVRALKRTESVRESSADKPAWLREALREWQNPVFPSADREARTYAENIALRPDAYERVRDKVHSKQHNITKDDLNRLDFIAQVDLKFLLFKLDSPIGTSLLLLDQHAADERIRVEAFLSTYWREITCKQVSKATLSEPTVLLFSARDAMAIDAKRGVLENWGFDLQLESENVQQVSDDGRQVTVTAVPQIFSERLSLDARLLQLTILSFLEHSSARLGTQQIASGTSWTTILRTCPTPVLDLINSRACRGAIMFNDELGDDECVNLLDRLAQTSFPFVCAHGRPSMAPLISLQFKRPKRSSRSQIDWSRLSGKIPHNNAV